MTRPSTGNSRDQKHPTAVAELRPQKDDRLTIVAHEVKTPLTVIRGQAQLLARLVRRSEVPEPQRERLLRGLARIDTSVDEVLATLEWPAGSRSPQEQEPTAEFVR